MDKDFYIGLDIGTNSIGFAVTDTEYNLIKARSRDYWGTVLFTEANTAVERRGFRTARRRLARRKFRLSLLEEIFAEEIAKVDFSFFIRIKQSNLKNSDKSEECGRYILFNDCNFSDKEFFKTYPTVFHLRRALMTDEIKDIRLLFLAVHHIIKNRGHFLFEGQKFDVNDMSVVIGSFRAINGYLAENDKDIISESHIDKIFEILCDESVRRSEKEKALLSFCLCGNDKESKMLSKALVKALSGGTFALKDLFGEEELCTDITKLCFEDAAFDEQMALLYGAFDDDKLALIDNLKKIHDVAALRNILHGHEYISEAKVEAYDKHKTDLKLLKDYVRDNCPEKYKRIFKSREVESNYAAYVGDGRKTASKDDFYKFLKKEIKGIETVFTDIEDGKFLPKQISGENCIIPYQLNLLELEAILKNAEKYFPFIAGKDDEGLTPSDKIISLMKFRIPYYVGPLSDDKNGKYNWLERRPECGDERITPWNFDRIVDRDKSEQKFIKRMTNKCSYLLGEDVLPASSLLYSEYVFLNELNNLKVNGEKRHDVKEVLFEYAKREKKLTAKKCVQELIRNNLLPEGSKASEVFTGIDGDFISSLSSYIDFRNIIGEKVDLYPEMCERIILWITVISDKSRLEALIKKEYGALLSDAEIKRMKSLNYTKWGRLSKKLLTEIYEVNEDGEIGNVSIIEKMRSSNENFMQLMSLSYGYSRAIEGENSTDDTKVTYKTVEELYCSPSVKRAIWNSIKVVREITKVMGHSPKKIFVEMTREQKDSSSAGKRTVTRKRRLLDMYKDIKDGERDWIDEIEKTEDLKFNSDKLYFYYTQMGIDVYTGKKIALEDIFNTNIYDVDHIYPQSKIKDDSLDNRVLVSKAFNEHEKKDNYPLPANVIAERRQLWTVLKDKKLISEEKYYRLTRSTALTVNECAEFINRQLVFTAQSTKAVAELLKREFNNEVEICYSKAANANDFKEHIKLVKIRELNDLHHAKDAYINIVCGNVFNTKFQHNARIYFSKYGTESYNLKKLYERDIDGCWRSSDEGRILSIAQKNTCRVINLPRTGKGQMFKATICPAGGNSLIPLKENSPLSDTSKYGGYTSVQNAYLMLVKSKDKKGRPMLTLERVTILADIKMKTKEDMLEYLRARGLKEPEICIDKIKLGSLLNYDGTYIYVNGSNGSQLSTANATQLYFNGDKDTVNYIKKISSYLRNIKKLNNAELKVGKEITKEMNIKIYDILTQKLGSEVYNVLAAFNTATEILHNGRDKFIELSEEEQCKVVGEILKITKCDAQQGDLTLIGGSKETGRVRPMVDVTKHNVKIIYQSITGYYYSVVDFKKFL